MIHYYDPLIQICALKNKKQIEPSRWTLFLKEKKKLKKKKKKKLAGIDLELIHSFFLLLGRILDGDPQII